MKLRIALVVLMPLAQASCLTIPYPYSRPRLVEGRIVDTGGQPISGVTVNAVRIAYDSSNPFRKKWRFVERSSCQTDANGIYRMKLPSSDRSLTKITRTSGTVVAYFACKSGYQMHKLFLPRRDLAVMRKVDEPPYFPPAEAGREWPSDASARCE